MIAAEYSQTDDKNQVKSTDSRLLIVRKQPGVLNTQDKMINNLTGVIQPILATMNLIRYNLCLPFNCLILSEQK